MPEAYPNNRFFQFNWCACHQVRPAYPEEDHMANTASDILKMMREQEIEWVDLRFTDPRGKWQHLTMAARVINEDNLVEGFMFDGSSIGGWKVIN